MGCADSKDETQQGQEVQDAPETRDLIIHWNEERTDNFTCAHEESIASAEGYTPVRRTGAILVAEADGTKPLKTFWSDGRQDNIGVVTDETTESLAGDGLDYAEVRTEGYVYTEQKEGTIALKLFFNGDRNDNMLCADDESIKSAEEAGYTEIRTE